MMVKGSVPPLTQVWSMCVPSAGFFLKHLHIISLVPFLVKSRPRKGTVSPRFSATSKSIEGVGIIEN